ncbi:hypothetical protein [Pseudomonas fluorescens]|uniref:hypothetical protein n=1 Tax=Pseudomonas fluorescens TaxID=294 RepID=UPI0010717A93|nr:hypothetical protein [Pseudomonas fluorescens]
MFAFLDTAFDATANRHDNKIYSHHLGVAPLSDAIDTSCRSGRRPERFMGGCQRMMSLDLNAQQWRMATVRRETVAILIYFYLGDFCANKLASPGLK